MAEEILIDTHAHLDFPEYDIDRDEVVKRAEEAGVRYIITVGTDVGKAQECIEIAGTHPNVFASVGMHPHYADGLTEAVWRQIRELSESDKVVAIGEVGLDYYRNESSKEAQIALFRKMLYLSRERDLPVIIHCREAFDDVLDILRDFGSREKLKGVVHCFSGTAAEAAECLRLGLHISFTGNITFKKAEGLREVAREVPIEKMLLETDCPYLAPVPKRGKRNEPAYVVHTARFLAELKGLAYEDVARNTTLAAHNLFSVGPKPPEGKIVYETRGSLYINLTNRCSNECEFCIRSKSAFVKGHHLRLKREPAVAEVLKAIGQAGRYKEIVFCGYGEPTERFEDLKKIAGEVKKQGAKVRMVTNGEGPLINGRAIGKELAGLVDRLSVSVNTADVDQYHKLCRSRYGQSAFSAIIEFIKDAKKYVEEIEITALDLPGVDVEKVRRLAEQLGTKFRIRHYNEVG